MLCTKINIIQGSFTEINVKFSERFLFYRGKIHSELVAVKMPSQVESM